MTSKIVAENSYCSPFFLSGTSSHLKSVKSIKNKYILTEEDECILYNHILTCVLSTEQLRKYGYPYQSPEDPEKTICNPSVWEKEKCANERICSRCSVSYSSTVEDGGSFPEKTCQYHKYKCEKVLLSGMVKHLYPCCGKRKGAPGCQWSLCHVFSGYDLNNVHFVSTRKKTDINKLSGIYSLDCEMCYTSNGLEVTRVSVISYDGELVYDTYVLPETPIIDYNTAFSGITADDLKDVTVRLSDVQENLLEIFDSDTILVGHALENDLKALRIIHETVVDTSILFPHKFGWPYRRSLKSLANTYLHCTIQENGKGHDSTEDARTCLKLLFCQMQTKC